MQHNTTARKAGNWRREGRGGRKKKKGTKIYILVEASHQVNQLICSFSKHNYN